MMTSATVPMISATEKTEVGQPAPNQGLPEIPGIISTPRETSQLTPVVTLVIWLGCLVVGVFGFVLPYVRPQKPVAVEQPPVEILNVELTPDMLPASTPGSTQLPPDALAQPNIPQPVAVAIPSPAVAFAVPVEGPARIVPAQNASYTRAKPAPVPVAPAAQKITFGQGEGRQPAPDYPLRARREGQEGTVGVSFNVDESGRVTVAEASEPSPWPLLNEAALRVIRDRWQFPTGKARAYEVSIRFQLTR